VDRGIIAATAEFDENDAIGNLARRLGTVHILLPALCYEETMWLYLGIGGAIMAGVALMWRAVAGRRRRIDLGSVSDAWLADHRRGRES
jgi:hypothetical protein